MKMIMIPWVFLQTLRKIQTCPLNELMMSIENNSIVPDSHLVVPLNWKVFRLQF